MSLCIVRLDMSYETIIKRYINKNKIIVNINYNALRFYPTGKISFC